MPYLTGTNLKGIKPCPLKFQKGDIVIADLTVTKDRQKKLDFTMPVDELVIY